MKEATQFLLAILIPACGMVACSEDETLPVPPEPEPPVEEIRVDTFTFSSDGVDTKGIIYVPDAFEDNPNLPAIYLIDYREQHFATATDEFEQLINGVQQTDGLDALVVTLEAHLNVDAIPASFELYRDVFINMASYVDDTYTDNTSRTFVGRGSEGGVVLLTMLSEDPESPVFEKYIATDSPLTFYSAVRTAIDNAAIPQTMPDKRLHFSYSASNDQESCVLLINAIEDAAFPWLTFASTAYPLSYTSAYPTAFAEGLEFVFGE